MGNVTTDTLDPRITEMVRRIVDQFHPDKIYLFGSHARGNPAPDSDVDLLVVMPVEDTREKAMQIDLALSDRKIPLDLIVATPQMVDRHRKDKWSVIGTAAREGKVMYERAA